MRYKAQSSTDHCWMKRMCSGKMDAAVMCSCPGR